MIVNETLQAILDYDRNITGILSTPKKSIEKSKNLSETHFNLRKMNPDTQKVIDRLNTNYPRLKPLFDSMVVKDYESEIVQQHLADLNLLPESLITKIIEKNIVFFISNE